MQTWAIVELTRVGFSAEEIKALGRIERALHRWAEDVSGDGNGYASWATVRDEDTGKTYREVHPHTGKTFRQRIPDRETGALKRLAAIMTSHPDCVAYHQGDPRGRALWIIPRNRLKGDVDACYTDGIVVC